MASITRATIPTSALPSSGATVERLALWAILALKTQNGQKGATEVAGGAVEPFVQIQTFEAPDGSYRLIGRLNLRLDPAYITDGTKKFWEFAQEITPGDTPANYL
jgi:hypothetical protein